MNGKHGLLDAFDVIFASTFTCFLPPPYDTASEVSDAIQSAIDRSAHIKAIIRHYGKARRK